MGREDCGIWSFLPIIALLPDDVVLYAVIAVQGIANLPHVVYIIDRCLYVIAY